MLRACNEYVLTGILATPFHPPNSASKAIELTYNDRKRCQQAGPSARTGHGHQGDGGPSAALVSPVQVSYGSARCAGLVGSDEYIVRR